MYVYTTLRKRANAAAPRKLPRKKSAIKKPVIDIPLANGASFDPLIKVRRGLQRASRAVHGFKVARNHISKRSHKVQTLGKPAICMLLPRGVCTLGRGREGPGRQGKVLSRARAKDLFIVITKVWAPGSPLPRGRTFVCRPSRTWRNEVSKE